MLVSEPWSLRVNVWIRHHHLEVESLYWAKEMTSRDLKCLVHKAHHSFFLALAVAHCYQGRSDGRESL